MRSIHVCPLCAVPALHDDQRGWFLTCDHPPYDHIEPVELRGKVRGGSLVFDLIPPEEWRREFGDAQLEREQAELVRRINWLALSCGERVLLLDLHGDLRRRRIGLARRPQPRDRQETSAQAAGVAEMTIECPRCGETACPNAVSLS